jgi:hydroxyacylglutathione hydrolase
MHAITLEDHGGDIVEKARQASQVSREKAARAAQLGLDEFAAFEATGRAPKTMDVRTLASLLHLNGPKLEAVLHGWVPPAIALNRWRELRQIATSLEGNAVNCYLAWDEVTREAALFDTGWEAAPVFAQIAQNQLTLQHIFITHAHDDHVAALPDLVRKFPRVRVHSCAASAPAEQRNRPQDCTALGGLRITFRATPGHSEDGATYVVGGFPEELPMAAVVGDALFSGSMGRGFQSAPLLKQKVLGQILTLPQPTLLCPGHGPLTSVAVELAHNPFFD